MQPCDALKSESDDASGAAIALLTARGLLNAWNPQPDRARNFIEPWQAFGRYRGVSDYRSASLVVETCGLSGHLAQFSGEVDAAVRWYEMAVARIPGTGYAMDFAALVVDYDLRAHANIALWAMTESQALFRKEPFWRRWFYTALAFVYYSRCHPRFFAVQRRNKLLIQQLQMMVQPGDQLC